MDIVKKAYLLLADGTLFEGTAVGYEGQSIGEVVFNTGMAGYQEVLTDPSYYGQVVTMTYPLIGNYGINFDDYESRKSWVSGFIMREMCEYPSNWRCKVTLDEYLKAQKVVGLAGIDTRRLTRKLRGEGVMNGVIYTEGFEPDEQTIEKMKDKLFAGDVDSLLFSAKDVNGLKVVTASRENTDANDLRKLGDFLRDKNPNTVAALGSVNGEKVTLLAVCGKNAVARGIKAGDIIKNIAPIVGGKGGGKPDSAMGGGTNALKLDDALAAVDDYVAVNVKD